MTHHARAVFAFILLTSFLLHRQASGADAAEKNIWRGKITATETKQPIAGAKVSAYPRFFSDFDGIPKPIASTTTDASGDFAITAAGSWLGDMGSSICLRAEADGRASELLLCVLKPPTEREIKEPKFSISLTAAGAISGRVVDESGVGISGAHVGQFYFAPPYDDNDQITNVLPLASGVAVSGVGGEFTLPNLPANADIRLPVIAEGFVHVVSPAIKVGTNGVRIVLSRGSARIHGRVLLVDGSPAPFRTVHIGEEFVGDFDPYLLSVGGWRATTNADGTFSVGALDPGTYQLHATSSVGVSDSTYGGAQLARGDDAEVNLTYFGEVALHGRCIDATTNCPIAGIELSTQRPGQPKSEAPQGGYYNAVSDAKGEFILNNVHIRDDQVDFSFQSAVPWLPEDAWNSGRIAIHHVERKGSSIQADIFFRRAVRLTGTVLQPYGAAPAPGATVRFTLAGAGASSKTVTDSSGRFTIDTFPFSSVSLVCASNEGEANMRVEVTSLGAQTLSPIVLQNFAKISGQVRDADGHGVSGLSMYGTVTRLSAQPMDQQAIWARTGESGYYLLDKVPPDSTTNLSIWSYGKTWKTLAKEFILPAPRTITLTPGSEKQNVDFVLSRAMAIDGVVLDADTNAPIADAHISSRLQSGLSPTGALSDASGHFTVIGIPPDTAVGEVEASQHDYDPSSQKGISPGAGAPVFKMHKKIAAKLTVLNNGAPVSSYEYRLLLEINLNVYDAGIAKNGLEAFPAIRPIGRGEWLLEVLELSASGAPTGRQGLLRISNPAGVFSRELTVNLGEARKITGQIVHPDKSGVAGAKVMLRKVSETPRTANQHFQPAEVTADSTGHFTIPGIFPRPQKIVATADGLTMAEPITVDVPPDHDPPPVLIIMAGRGAIFGKVTGKNGAPIAGLIVADQFAGPDYIHQTAVARTDSEGKYRIANVLPGDHKLGLHGPAGNKIGDVRTQPIAPGEEKQIDFANAAQAGGRSR